jgi:hypothetical protein
MMGIKDVMFGREVALKKRQLVRAGHFIHKERGAI